MQKHYQYNSNNGNDDIYIINWANNTQELSSHCISSQTYYLVGAVKGFQTQLLSGTKSKSAS